VFGIAADGYARFVRERETKLLVDAAFRVPALDGVTDGLRLGSEQHVDLRAHYFDTPDFRLTRSGASLRFRSDDSWTLKIPESTAGASLTRIEHVFPGDLASLPEAALDLARAWIRTETVREVAHVRTRRHRFVLTDASGARMAEIDDDRVTTHAASRPRCDFREVEIELDERAPAQLGKRLTNYIRHAGPTHRSTIPKIARALGVDELTPIDVDAMSRPRPHATMTEFVQALVSGSAHRLLAHDSVIRIGDDPEGVHQARVATRRLRADLRTFRRVLDQDWSEGLRAELRWLGRALGAVRDADVLAILLEGHRWSAPESHRPGVDALLRELEAQRARKREELLRSMRSPRYARLLDRLVDASHAPKVLDEVATKRARPVAYRLARRPWRRLRKSIAALGPSPEDPALHEVRRRAKHARYATESLAVLDSDWPEAVAARAEALQEILGEHQDRVVARAWLEDIAPDRPDLAFLAGELAARLSFEQDDLRERARVAWKVARKQRVTRAK
jgi:CHAD domain-containing protein